MLRSWFQPLSSRASRQIKTRSTIPLLCVLLTSSAFQTSSANGLLMKKGSVVLHASRTSLIYPCPPNSCSNSGSCPKTFEAGVRLRSEVKDFHKQAIYAYTVTGGRVAGEGSEVSWDLTGVSPGFYMATVEVQDNSKNRALSSVTVTVVGCSDCITDCEFWCPTIAVTCYDKVNAGTPITCRVDVTGLPKQILSVPSWSARSSNGEDLSARITSNGRYVSIPTNDLAGTTVYATVKILGVDPSCNSTASYSAKVGP